MKQDFKNVAYMSVFVLIVDAGFYLFDFYDSAFFTLLVGLTLLAIYHAGLYNIERDKDLIDFLHGHIGFLEDYIKEIKEESDKVKSRKSKR